MSRLLLNRTTLGISSIATSYFLYVFNGSLSTIRVMTGIEGPYEGFYEGLLVSGLFIGAIVGSFIALIAVKKSRSSRMIIRMVDLFTLIAMYLSCITNIWTIILGRVLFGVVGGVAVVFIPIFVKETTPVEVYGMMGGFDKLL